MVRSRSCGIRISSAGYLPIWSIYCSKMSTDVKTALMRRILSNDSYGICDYYWSSQWIFADGSLLHWLFSVFLLSWCFRWKWKFILVKTRATTHLKQTYCRVPLSTTRAAVTIGLVIAFLLMVAFCIDCSRYYSFHDVSGGNGNGIGYVSWWRRVRQLTWNKRIVECHLYRDTREHENFLQQRKLLKWKATIVFLWGKKGGLHANVRKEFMDTEMNNHGHDGATLGSWTPHSPVWQVSCHTSTREATEDDFS